MIQVLDRGALTPLGAEVDGLGLFAVALPPSVRVFGEVITVPVGFRSDGASIPWWMRWRFESWGRCAIAALIHDWLLSLRDRPKREIDLIFLGVLQAEGVPDFQAVCMYLAVRTRP